ncbi:phage tail domain-containing protein [Pontibacillus salicampi]|uniref:Phage tail domain-containing protein n=1 Tax=Pontibacillus salicampi TaxID=1449801 RepID=A0ABV6LTN0_9BACI
MKSELNFKIEYADGSSLDMHDIGLWVESFHMYSPNAIREKEEVPGMSGAHLTSTRIGERKVHIAFQVETNSIKDMDAKRHEIYRTFFTKKEFKIIRDLTPDKYIKILQEGEYDIDYITCEDGEFELDLIMVDPFIYGEEQRQVIHDPDHPEDADSIIHLDSDEEVEPVYRVTFKEPTTFFSIATPKDLFMLGAPYSIDESQYDPSPLVLYDNMGDVTEWTENGLVPVDGGNASNYFKTDGSLFFVTSYGSGDGWHGPAARRDLPRALDNWVVDVSFKLFLESEEEIGRVELYLIAEDGSTLGKMAIKDVFANSNNAIGEIRLGGLENGIMLVKGNGYRPGSYNNNIMRFWMRKLGTQYKAQFGEITDRDEHVNRMNGKHEDNDKIFDKRLAAVQVHAAKASGHKFPAQTFILDLYVDELAVEEQENNIPYIANAGDELLIDCRNHSILFNGRDILPNGEEAISLRNMYTDFFSLHPGINSLGVLPKSAAKVETFYQPKTL